MKNAACILALAATIAAGCAVPQLSTQSQSASAVKSSTYYCAKERLAGDGARLECNWQPSAEEACKFSNSQVLERDTLASDPQPAGRCNTGQWLVKVPLR